MVKKYFAFVLFFIIGGIIFPTFALADGTYNIDVGGVSTPVYYRGFVPCGKEICAEPYKDGQCPTTFSYKKGQTLVYCQLCHFFVMLNNIVKYVLTYIVPPLAILFLVLGGVMFYLGGAKPELVSKGKTVLMSVVIGIFLIYGAYMIVGLFLNILGVAEWTGLANWAEQGPFSIECPIKL